MKKSALGQGAKGKGRMPRGKWLMVQGVTSGAQSGQMVTVPQGGLEARLDLQRRNAQHPPQSSKVQPASNGIPVHDKCKVKWSEEKGASAGVRLARDRPRSLQSSPVKVLVNI